MELTKDVNSKVIQEFRNQVLKLDAVKNITFSVSTKALTRIKITIPKSFLKEHSDALYVFEYLWGHKLKNAASEVQNALQSFGKTHKIMKDDAYIVWYDDYGVEVSLVKDKYFDDSYTSFHDLYKDIVNSFDNSYFYCKLKMEDLYNMAIDILNKTTEKMKKDVISARFRKAVLLDMGFSQVNETVDDYRIKHMLVNVTYNTIQKMPEAEEVFQRLWDVDWSIKDEIESYKKTHKNNNKEYIVTYNDGECQIGDDIDEMQYFLANAELPYREDVETLVKILRGIEEKEKEQKTTDVPASAEKKTTSIRLTYLMGMNKFRVEENYTLSTATTNAKRYSSEYINFYDLNKYSKYFTLVLNNEYQKFYEEQHVREILESIFPKTQVDAVFDYSYTGTDMYYFLSDKGQLMKFTYDGFKSLDKDCGSVIQRNNLIFFSDVFRNASVQDGYARYKVKKQQSMDIYSVPYENEVNDPLHQETPKTIKKKCDVCACSDDGAFTMYEPADALKLDGTYLQNIFAITKFFNQRIVNEAKHDWDRDSVLFAKYAVLNNANLIELMYDEIPENELCKYKITSVRDFIAEKKKDISGSFKETMAKTVVRKMDERFTWEILHSDSTNILDLPYLVVKLSHRDLGSLFETYKNLKKEKQDEVAEFVLEYVKEHTGAIATLSPIDVCTISIETSQLFNL